MYRSCAIRRQDLTNAPHLATYTTPASVSPTLHLSTMHHRFALAALLASALSLPAQGLEWVVNGDFTGALTPWVMGGGYSVNPGHEVGWDTTGMGASDSFGCQPGGQVTPAPYPANTIEQDLLIIQGLTYEFRCDARAPPPQEAG